MIQVAAVLVILVVVIVLWRLFLTRENTESSEHETLGPTEPKKTTHPTQRTTPQVSTTPKNESPSSKSAKKRRKKTTPKHHDKSTSPESSQDSAPPSSRPLSIAPPPNEFDSDWDDVDITVVAELPDEVKALQKGFRSVDPKQALSEAIRTVYDGTAEIEVLAESTIDSLLIEELLTDSPTGPHALMLPVGAVLSDMGRRRPNNEDQALSIPEHLVFAVADGMGGHAAGEVASRLAVETIENAFKTGEFQGEPNSLWPRRGDELARTIEMANRVIFEQADENDEFIGMGTTLTAIRFSPERQRAYIAHVGDSRCYRIRDGEMRQITKDHTLGAELGAKGSIATHLSRSVGISEIVEVDLTVDIPQIGDRYLLCTDGLTKMITEERILVMTQEGEVKQCARNMVDEANANGGKDNVTVAVIEIRHPLEDKSNESPVD